MFTKTWLIEDYINQIARLQIVVLLEIVKSVFYWIAKFLYNTKLPLSNKSYLNVLRGIYCESELVVR